MSFTQIALHHPLLLALSSFALWIYNAAYECLFAWFCTDFPLPLLLYSMYAPPTFYLTYIMLYMSFLPIMLSISVCLLLLAGWTGLEADCHNSFITLNISPPALSLSLFFLSLPFLHLLPFTCLLLTCPPLFLSLPPFLLYSLSRCLTLFPLSPPALFWRFPSLSHFFFFFNNCHMPLHPASHPPRHEPSVPITHVSPAFHIHGHALSTYHVRFGVICRVTICPITEKNPAMQKRFPYRSQQRLLTALHITVIFGI